MAHGFAMRIKTKGKRIEKECGHANGPVSDCLVNPTYMKQLVNG